MSLFAVVMSLACITTTSAVAAPAGKTSGDAIVLKFPADRSLGGIGRFLKDNSTWDRRVRHDGIARGIRTFPAGTKLRLYMNYDCAKEPERLLHLDRSFISIDGRSLDNLSDETLSYLGKMPQLTELKVDETDVSNAGLKYLVPLKNLIMLSASHTLITGEGLSDIEKLSGLERLELCGTRLSDASISKLESLKQLHLLGLSRTGIGDEGVAHLQALANVERLWLADNQRITDKSVAYLARLPNLHDLDVSGTGITGGSVKYLLQCKGLVHLELNPDKYSPADMKLLHQGLPHCVVRVHQQKAPTELFDPLH
jgi:hypothetical protein